MSTETTAALHPMAPHHLPSFISDASGYDPMLTNVGIFALIMVFLVVTFFLHLHSLPEKLAHEVGANQLQIVGVLALIALFTHNNLYWVAALLLALIRFPDFQSPLERMASALERLVPQTTRASDMTEPQLSNAHADTTAEPSAPSAPAAPSEQKA